MPSRPAALLPTADPGPPPPVSRVRALATVLALVLAYVGFALGSGADVRLAAGPVLVQSGATSAHLAAREAGRVVLSADRSADPTLPPPPVVLADLPGAAAAHPGQTASALRPPADRPAHPRPTGAHRPRAPPIRSA